MRPRKKPSAVEMLRRRSVPFAMQEDDRDRQHEAQDKMDQYVAHVEHRGRSERRDIGGVQQEDEERPRAIHLDSFDCMTLFN